MRIFTLYNNIHSVVPRGGVYAVYNMYAAAADRSILYEGVVELLAVINLYIFIVIITVKFHPRPFNTICTPTCAYILKFKK